jgi:hypothetical protein
MSVPDQHMRNNIPPPPPGGGGMRDLVVVLLLHTGADSVYLGGGEDFS